MTIKPVCELLGTDGNVFAIIGNVSKTLKNNGMIEMQCIRIHIITRINKEFNCH